MSQEHQPQFPTDPTLVSEYTGDVVRELQRRENLAKVHEEGDAEISSAWDDYTDRQLSDMLLSDSVSSDAKDDIARYVNERTHRTKGLPTDND